MAFFEFPSNFICVCVWNNYTLRYQLPHFIVHKNALCYKTLKKFQKKYLFVISIYFYRKYYNCYETLNIIRTIK